MPRLENKQKHASRGINSIKTPLERLQVPHIESTFPGSEREVFCLLVSSGGIACCFGLLFVSSQCHTASVLSPNIHIYSSFSLTYQLSHSSQRVKGPDPGTEKPLEL